MFGNQNNGNGIENILKFNKQPMIGITLNKNKIKAENRFKAFINHEGLTE